MPFSLLMSRCLVDGRWVDAADGQIIEVRNPANGERVGQVPRLGAADARTAI